MTMAVVLQRHRPCFCNADCGPIDIPTPNGRYVGNIDERLRMADEFGPDGLVVFIEKDEFDIPVIVVKRLPPEVR